MLSSIYLPPPSPALSWWGWKHSASSHPLGLSREPDFSPYCSQGSRHSPTGQDFRVWEARPRGQAHL